VGDKNKQKLKTMNTFRNRSLCSNMTNIMSFDGWTPAFGRTKSLELVGTFSS